MKCNARDKTLHKLAFANREFQDVEWSNFVFISLHIAVLDKFLQEGNEQRVRVILAITAWEGRREEGNALIV